MNRPEPNGRLDFAVGSWTLNVGSARLLAKGWHRQGVRLGPRLRVARKLFGVISCFQFWVLLTGATSREWALGPAGTWLCNRRNRKRSPCLREPLFWWGPPVCRRRDIPH